jgi:hypothetical protein
MTNKIQFYKRTWVLKQHGGGFAGIYNTTAVEIDPVSFDVLSVKKDEKTQASTIHVWSQNAMDGYNTYLINVPSGMFKEVNDEKN